MDFTWCNILPILVGIGSALIGGIIGWNLRRSRINDLEASLDEKNADYAHLRNAHEMLDIRHSNIQKDHVSLSITHNNLIDSINTLEKDHAALSESYNLLGEQKAKFEKDYLTLSASFNQLEAQSSSTESVEYSNLSLSHNTLETSNDELKERIAALESDLDAVENAKTILTKHFVSYRTTAEHKIEELHQANATLQQNQSVVETSSSFSDTEIADLENQLTYLEEENRRLKIEKVQNDNRITELVESKEEWQTSYHTLFQQHKESQNTVSEVDETIGTRIAELEAAIEEKENSYKILLNQFETNKSQLAEMQAQIAERQESYHSLLSHSETGSHRVEELESLVNEKENRFLTLYHQQEASHKRVNELEALVTEKENRFLTLYHQQEANASRIADLEALINENDTRFLALVNQYETGTNHEAEMQTRIDEKENSYQALVSQYETNTNQLAKLQIQARKWEQAYQEVSTQLEEKEKEFTTLQQSLHSAEVTSPVVEVENNTESHEKELAQLQDAKAQLEISLTQLKNDLDILRGTYSEVLVEKEALTELEKASRVRLEYLEQQNFELRIDELEKELTSLKNAKNGYTNGHTVMAEFIKPDDLKVVEGIGPKIEAVLHNAGILTFEQLASTNPDNINAILDAAGPRYRLHNPSSWPTQAELAAKNDWDKLKKLKEQLIAGKEKATE
jgi:predicted flap endonuclease-1-like 5' DNA nuclease